MNVQAPPPNDYIRLSVALFDNPKLAKLADHEGMETYTIWIYLLLSAKRARFLGRIIAPPVRVSRMVGLDVALTERIIEGLVRIRSLVRIDPDGDPWHFQIRNWHTWQSMTKSERDKK